MCTAIVCRPCSPYFEMISRSCGILSLQIPHDTAQKCTSVGLPLICSCISSHDPLNHVVAPSKEGIGSPILIGIAVTPLSDLRISICDLRLEETEEPRPIANRHSQIANSLDLQILLPGRPIGSAEAAGLQALQDAQGFVDRASDVQVVDDRILENAFRVDDEQTAKGDVRFFHQDVVCTGQFSAHV